ncbi:MAG: hypothetical protein RAO94_00215 [Candidatus Stygibacter australis]|nr:hypothetical protein [Candidatus Stygibacter australis]MDP8320750.1 hypothetical protein [Candidatus Stygibacter australis]
MKKMFMRFFMVLFISLFLTGCLTTEFKEYRFTINSDGSGSGSIKFINLVSEEDDEKDVSFADFQELINDYLQGEQFETDNPAYQVTSKELYEENGQICATVEFTFTHYSDVNFFQYDECNCAPMMYYAGDLSETVIEIDGESVTEDESIPVYTWDSQVKNFYIKTSVKEDMTDAHNFLDLYKLWKGKQ